MMPEQKLWVAVIRQAGQHADGDVEACHLPVPSKGKSSDTEAHKLKKELARRKIILEARRFFTDGRCEFVCDLVNIDYDTILARASNKTWWRSRLAID